MKYYLAPLEGITTFVYRNAVNKFFGGIDKFYTPFFSPQTKRHKNSYAIRGIMPENNPGMKLIPQILTEDAKDYLLFERDMLSYGYDELNINTGCPSGTVVSKGRGAGFLQYPDKLESFLDEVFDKAKTKISIKTRLGMYDPEEFIKLLEIFNKYPLEELIIHLRVGKEMYKGEVHKEYFDYAIKNSRNPVVYNGDVTGIEDIKDLPEGTDCVMLGRGMITDPSLARVLDGGEKMNRSEAAAFLQYLKDEYLRLDPDENHNLFKLKEVWSYMQANYPEKKKELKGILKAKRLEEYQVYVDNILS